MILVASVGTPLSISLVAVGAAVGAMVRHRVARAAIPVWARTWVVNVVGAGLLGGLVGYSPSEPVLLALGTGLCGALTTVSSLMLEASERTRLSPGQLISMHLTFGLIAAFVGLGVGYVAGYSLAP